MQYFTKNALKTIIPNIIKVVGKTADNIVLGGAVQNVAEETVTHPKGKLDSIKLVKTIGYTSIPIMLLVALFAGWITVEELKELLDLF